MPLTTLTTPNTSTHTISNPAQSSHNLHNLFPIIMHLPDLLSIFYSQTSGNHVRDSFPQFLRLPKEVRDIIWEYALPGPRLIEVYGDDTISLLASRCNKNGDTMASCRTEVFGALFDRESWKANSPLNYVCHESRTIAKKEIYEFCLNSNPKSINYDSFPPSEELEKWRRRSSHGNLTKGVRFRPDKDTIYFRIANNKLRRSFNIQLSCRLGEIGTSKVKSIALDEGLHNHYDSWQPFFHNFSGEPLLPNLEEFIIIQNGFVKDRKTNQKMEDDWTTYISQQDAYTEFKRRPDQVKVRFIEQDAIRRGEVGRQWDLPPLEASDSK